MINAKSNKKGIIQTASMVMTDSLRETAHILMVISMLYIIAPGKSVNKNQCLEK